MKRFPAYEPPEYVAWQEDPDLIAAFGETVRAQPERAVLIDALSLEGKLELYEGMLRARLHDIALQRWVRQGVISKAWLATGEEATTIGPVHALDRSIDVVAPMIRNAGACAEMGMPVADMLRGYLGSFDSPSKGRDGHVGDFSRRVLQPISNIGNMPPVACGVALAFRMQQAAAVVVTWIGDGSVASGPTHEAFNFAAVQALPVIFIIQNNQIALGTMATQHRLPDDFDDVARAYGCSGWGFDGNNVLDAYAATRIAADQCRAGRGPVILTAETFRMGGHATHDEQDARRMIPQSTYDYWGKRDPIGTYEGHLRGEGLSEATLAEVERRVTEEVDLAAAEALQSREANMPPPDSALDDVYTS